MIGDDVNIASRIEPFSASGGIAISNKVNDALVREKEFETKYLGKPKLKGVGQKVEVFCITSHGLPETKVSKVSAKLEPEGFQWNVFSLTGAVLTVIGVLFWINVSFLGIGIADTPDVPSIAILPFENKGAPEDDFYAYGISSDLISDVTSAGLIRVASLKDIEKLEYQNLETSALAKKLFVRYVAQGTLWKMDSIFQLSMEIFDTELSKVIYTKRWQTNWKDLATIKDDLSDNILETLEIEVLWDVEDQIVESNPEAYEYYLRAGHKYKKRQNEDDIEIAKGLLKKAIELDNNLIEAKLLLGLTYTNMGDFDKSMKKFSGALEQSGELGDKSGIGQSLNNIGNIYYHKGEYDQALDYYNRSLKIWEELGNKSGIGKSLNNIGVIYVYKGEYNKAVEYLEKSLHIKQEIGVKGLELFTTTYFYLAYKQLGKDYDEQEIHRLIKEEENIEFEINFRLYELLEDNSYLETAYNQIQEKADVMDDELKEKFLSYPIPKQIIQEWERVS